MEIARPLGYGFAAAVGSTMLTMATVTPEQADTAVAGWLMVLGLQQPPAQLVTENANMAVFLVGAVFLLIAVFGFFEWWWRRNKAVQRETPLTDALYQARAAIREARAAVDIPGGIRGTTVQRINPVLKSALLSIERDCGLPIPVDGTDYGQDFWDRLTYLEQVIPLLAGDHRREALAKAQSLVKG